MTTTTCYAMVRGSAIRVTGLDRRGVVGDPIMFATSKSVTTVTLNENVESGTNQLVRTDDTDEARLRETRPDQMTNFTADVAFTRVDPGVLSLVAGVPQVLNDSGEVVGFDSETRRPAAAFALEVWSRLANEDCAPGERKYGYTVFPFLKGGYLSGFEFKNGLVSFNLLKAQTRKMPLWGVGPYDLEGPHERLVEVVSRNTLYRQMLTTAPPPAQANGVQTTTDVIEGGTATMTTADIVDGEFVDTSVWIVEGGGA